MYLDAGENVIVYCSQKTIAEKYARKIVEDSSFPEIDTTPFADFFQHIQRVFEGGEEWIVVKALRKGVHIADDSYIGMFCFIDNTYPEYIYIEKHVSISKGASIVAHNNPMPHFNKTMIAQVAPIILREGSLVALDCILNPGVEVGEYAIVSAGSVVYGKVEPMTIVRGNPAEKIRDVKLSDELTQYVQDKVAKRLKQEAAEKAARKQEKRNRLNKEAK